MSRYFIGIDLGTSNTVLAYADREDNQKIQLFEVEQLVALGEVARRPQLPSLRYHPSPGELKPSDLRLPWTQDDPAAMAEAIIGSLAGELGAQVPGHLVSSAKSWLSHRSVDRTAAILPWGTGEDVTKISPLTASASYLAHMRAAWNHKHPNHPLEQQEVVLTVPASFDEGARTLTLQAAKHAGLVGVRLLEEPQAAFYNWLHSHSDGLEDNLAQTRLVLVCDVGGGTTDLSLIKVETSEYVPSLTRIGVGDHLMLGGDNMDLALAHIVEARIAIGGGRLSAANLAQLNQQCRSAKERLLSPASPESVKVTLLGAGAKLIGGARSAELYREEVNEMILEGFFPRTSPNERPRRVRGGIIEFGLPYAADPAITRHIADFLACHSRVSAEALAISPAAEEIPVPDTLLLNGGVFLSEALSERLLEILQQWRGKPLRRLFNDHPEQAVARGAVAYALGRAGRAPRIGGGSARSYFLALDEDDTRRHAVCLLPRGTQEGQELLLTERNFSLLVGKPVGFHLYASTADTPWGAGELVALDKTKMPSLPPIATVLDAEKCHGRAEIPVQLAATLTEVGTLEVQCVSASGQPQRWKLEFQLRGHETQAESISAAMPPRFTEASQLIERMYGQQKKTVEPKEIKRLHSELERLLGPREEWHGMLLRELFEVLWDGAGKRRRSSDHERIWLNLVGFCLRPGYGYPLDDWRVEQLWNIYPNGIQFGKEARNWAEWWILWRRVAGGLDEAAQGHLFEDISYYLQPSGTAKRPPGQKKQGYDDMVRLLASLERLPVEHKIEMGGWLLKRLRKPKENIQTWWAIGRLGAREPIYGSTHQVVTVKVAEQWLLELLEQDWKKKEPAAFAATLLTRMTGDRERDIGSTIRNQVIEQLRTIKAPPSWVKMVTEVVELSAVDKKRFLGDSLPVGLRLLE
ncbi:MAG: Hsp70 family protein [Chromatiales bacterium]|jgi:molecular chaperone DnaK (HSP70)